MGTGHRIKSCVCVHTCACVWVMKVTAVDYIHQSTYANIRLYGDTPGLVTLKSETGQGCAFVFKHWAGGPDQHSNTRRNQHYKDWKARNTNHCYS